MAERSRDEVLTRIHDQVAEYVKQLDDLMRGLEPEEAATLVDPARHLLTVVTFLRDATLDLLEAAGSPEEADSIGLDPITNPGDGPEPIRRRLTLVAPYSSSHPTSAWADARAGFLARQ